MPLVIVPTMGFFTMTMTTTTFAVVLALFFMAVHGQEPPNIVFVVADDLGKMEGEKVRVYGGGDDGDFDDDDNK